MKWVLDIILLLYSNILGVKTKDKPMSWLYATTDCVCMCVFCFATGIYEWLVPVGPSAEGKQKVQHVSCGSEKLGMIGVDVYSQQP